MKRILTSVIAVVVAGLSFVVASPMARAALPQPPGGLDLTRFVIDGNPTGPFDWDSPYDSTAGTPIGYQTSGLLPFWTPTPPNGPFANPDVCGNVQTDDIFVPGTKLNQLTIDNAGPLVTTGNALNKGDLCNAYAALEIVNVPKDPANPSAGGQYHTILYGAWQRNNDPGQITFFIPLADQVPGNSPGDRIVEFDFDPNASPNTSAFLRTWNGTAWVRTGTGAPPANVFQGAVEPVNNPSFGEFAVDLTAINVLPEDGPCTTLTANFAFTETGNSTNATLKDYIGVDLPPLTNCSTLIVDKVAQPDPTTATNFGFTVDEQDGEFVRPNVASLAGTLTRPGLPATHPATGDPVTILNLLASPDYRVTETTLPPGWTQQSTVCTGIDPFTGLPFTFTLFPGPDPFFPLGPGRTATCTITNLGPPSVQLTKVVDPPTATGWAFQFTIAPSTGVTPGATQTVTDLAPTITWDNLTPGQQYTITETGVAPGYQAGAITCGLGGSTFTAVAGQAVTCTATNQQLAQLTVTKTAAPADDEVFNFSATNVTPGTFTLSDPTAPSTTFPNLAPGQTHTITETLSAAQITAGWKAVSVACIDALDSTAVPGTVDATGGTVTVTSKPGSNITCAFSNAQGSSITIQKAADPVGTPQDFPFTVTGPAGAPLPPQPILLDVDDDPTNPATTTIGNLPPGTYTVSEATPAGWVLTAFSCSLSDGTPIGTSDLATGTVTFTITEGQDVVCSYLNTQQGSITVDKVTDPSGAATVFDFTTTGLTPASFTLTDAGAPHVFPGLLPGNYTVTEAAEPGWLLTGLACVSSAGTQVPVDPATGLATIALVAGENVTCTYSNTQLGAITVDKVTDPAADPTAFDFTTTGLTPASFTLTDTAPPQAFNDLLPGSYSVTEADEPGWIRTGLACLSSAGTQVPVDPATGVATIALVPGETVDCTYTNTKASSITVVKQTDPANDPTVFSFTTTNLTPSTFTLTDNPVPIGAPFDPDFVQAFPGLLPDTYSVTETVPAGWNLRDLACVDENGPTGSLVGPTAELTLAAGQNAICTYVDEQLASVSVTKTVDPASATGWAFDFTISPLPAGETATKTATSANPVVSWINLVPGTAYTITEGPPPAGFQSGTVSCDGDGATFTPTPGQAVACQVTNQQLASVSVTKTVDPASATGWAFDFTINPLPAGETATKTATSANPVVSWINLVPGTAYTITEGPPPAGFQSGTVSCDGDGATFTPTPGQAVACQVTNIELGSITIDKVTDPAGDPTVFAFTTTGLEPAAFTLTDAGTPQAFTNLPPGTYSVTETVPAGWKLLELTCVDENGPTGELVGPTAQLTLVAGQNAICTYVDEELTSVSVTKTVDPADATGWAFDFTISPVPDGEIATKTATSAAPVVSWVNLIPGTEYTITEGPPPSGFQNGTVSCDEGGATFTPTPGQNVACQVTNIELGSISVTKSVTGAVATDTWSFAFSLSPAGSNTNPQTVAGTGSATANASWTNLPPGTYTLTESASADPRFATGTLTCGAVSGPASAGLTVALASGEDLECAATNTRLPTDISVLKTAAPLAVGPGSDVTYTIVVKVESATVPADDVVLNDPMPAGLTLRTVTSVEMTCTTAGNSFTCTKALMAPSETATVTVAATVDATAASGSTINNVATVETSTTETTLSNNSDDASISVMGVEVTPLPRTGIDVQNQLWLSALLLVVGGGILRRVRRRTA